MNDKLTLLASAILVAFFFVAGLFDLLDHVITKIILFVGFFGLGLSIVIVKSRDKS